MSTEQHGHHDEGGHELEAINTKLLFRLLISLSIVTLLASMAVVQWYYSQRSELERRHAVEGSFLLAQYKERMAEDIDGIELVRKQILADGKLLDAPAPPPGWVHPDDLLSGGAAVPAAPVEPKLADPKPVEPKPADAPIAVEGQPGIEVPAGEAKPEGETKPEGAAKPEEAKPEGEKPEAEKPAKPENEGKGDEKKAEEAKKEG